MHTCDQYGGTRLQPRRPSTWHLSSSPRHLMTRCASRACGDHLPPHDEGRSSVVVAHKVVLVMASGSKYAQRMSRGIQAHRGRRRLTSEILPYHRHNLRSLPKCVQPSWPAVPRNPFYIDRSFLASITGVRSGAVPAISKPTDSDGVDLLVSRWPKTRAYVALGVADHRAWRYCWTAAAALLQF